MPAQGQVPFEDLIDLGTCHDIRHWSACAHCYALGDNRRMVKVNREWMHGRCFVAAYSVREFLQLPRTETNKLSLGDLGVELMRALVNAPAK